METLVDPFVLDGPAVIYAGGRGMTTNTGACNRVLALMRELSAELDQNQLGGAVMSALLHWALATGQKDHLMKALAFTFHDLVAGKIVESAGKRQ